MIAPLAVNTITVPALRGRSPISTATDSPDAADSSARPTTAASAGVEMLAEITVPVAPPTTSTSPRVMVPPATAAQMPPTMTLIALLALDEPAW